MTDEEFADYTEKAVQALNRAGQNAVERKRRLGQHWVVWDGEKPVKVYPENSVDVAAE